tara:strand:- start:2186 stop:2656 length:471 start_codon:yes stop_codon:yes gene_type:complete
MATLKNPPTKYNDLYRCVISASDQGPITGGSFEQVVFDALDVDSVGAVPAPLNVATGEFTIPKTGLWMINVQIYCFTMNPSAVYTLTIDVNGVTAARSVATVDGTAHIFGAQLLKSLTAVSDKVTIKLKAAGSYNLTMIDGNSVYSWMDLVYHPQS